MDKPGRDLLALFSVIILLAVPSDSDAGPAATAARGRGFSVPVPTGFSTVSDERFAAITRVGGVVLVAARRAEAPGAFLGSIVVTPMSTPQGFNPTKPEVCLAGAQQMSKGTGAKVERAQIVDLPFGKTCQMATVDPKNANRIGLGTIAYRKGLHCMVVCNYDRRDATAIAACKTVVAGWKALP